MRKIFLLLFLASYTCTHAQSKLYYFVVNDTLVGVKNEKGKIIIPATHYNFNGVENNQPIGDDRIIYLMPEKKLHEEPQGFGVAYSRNGKILFTPYALDNGPDYLQEGLMRYVKNNKIGFVNRIGQVVIPAQYDYVSSFNYGIASYCNGCKWDHSKDSEHPTLKGGTWGYINSRGKEIKPTAEKNHAKDQLLDSGRYLPYQFSYTPIEQKIVDSFANISLISTAYFMYYSYPAEDKKEKILEYEIIEKPSLFFHTIMLKLFHLLMLKGIVIVLGWISMSLKMVSNTLIYGLRKDYLSH